MFTCARMAWVKPAEGPQPVRCRLWEAPRKGPALWKKAYVPGAAEERACREEVGSVPGGAGRGSSSGTGQEWRCSVPQRPSCRMSYRPAGPALRTRLRSARNEASPLGDLSGFPSCLDGRSASVLLSSLPRQPSEFTLCHPPPLGAHTERGDKGRENRAAGWNEGPEKDQGGE